MCRFILYKSTSYSQLTRGILFPILLLLPLLNTTYAQTLNGTWKGFLFDEGESYTLEMTFARKEARNVAMTQLGNCYATYHFSHTFYQSSGRVEIQEDRIVQSTNAQKPCRSLVFHKRKNLNGYVHLSADKSYLILQGEWQAAGKKGIFYVHRTAKQEDLAAFSRPEAQSNVLYSSSDLIESQPFSPGQWTLMLGGGKLQATGNELTVSTKGDACMYRHQFGRELVRSFLLQTNLRIGDFPQHAALCWDIAPDNSSYRYLRIRDMTLEIGAKIRGYADTVYFSQHMPQLLKMGETNGLCIQKVWNGVQYFVNGIEVYREVETASMDTEPYVALAVYDGTNATLSDWKVSSLANMEPQLSLGGWRYQDEASGASTLDATHPGQLQLTLSQTGRLPSPPLTLAIWAPEQPDGVYVRAPTQRTDSLTAGQSQTYSFDVLPTHLLAGGQFRLRAAILSGQDTIDISTASLPGQALLTAKTLERPDPNSTRSQLISGIMGIGQPPLSRTFSELNPQNLMERAWAAYFHYEGDFTQNQNPNVSQELMEDVVPQLEERARRGSAEAIFLLSCAAETKTTPYQMEGYATYLLDQAADAGYAPAIFHRAKAAYLRQDYLSAVPLLQEALESNCRMAGVYLGQLYADGLANGRKSRPQAVAALTEAAKQGLPEACIQLSLLYRRSDLGVEPDIAKADYWLAQAEQKGAPPARVAWARTNKPVDLNSIETDQAWVQEYIATAKAGKSNAMLFVGLHFLEGARGFPKDVPRGLYWIERAAVSGNGSAMTLLTVLYQKGEVVGKDVIRAMYWRGMAVKAGMMEELEGNSKSFGQLLEESLQFELGYESVYRGTKDPLVPYGREYVGEEVSLTSTFFNIMFATGFNLGVAEGDQQRSQKQTYLDGIRQIGINGNTYLYGSVLTSLCNTGIQVEEGESIVFDAYGDIRFWHAHNTGTSQLFAGRNSQPRTRDTYDAAGEPAVKVARYTGLEYIPHGALMYRINDGPWRFVGTHSEVVVDRSGRLDIGINDSQWRNNFGYYYVTLQISQ